MNHMTNDKDRITRMKRRWVVDTRILLLALVMGAGLVAHVRAVESHGLLEAIEKVNANDYSGALPGLVAASARGERLGTYYIGLLLLNDHLFDKKRLEEVTQLEKLGKMSFKMAQETRFMLERIMLFGIVKNLGKLFIAEGISGLQDRADAGDLDAMVDLAIAHFVLETEEEKKKRIDEGSLYSGKTLGLLERAANKGSERAVQGLFGHYSMECLFGSEKCQLDQLRRYGCILVKKGDKKIKELLQSRFRTQPCE